MNDKINKTIKIEDFLETIKLKLDDLEMRVKNIKSRFPNIEEKKNRILEDDLIQLELERTSISEQINKHRSGENLKNIIEKLIKDYEQDVIELEDKYNF